MTWMSWVERGLMANLVELLRERLPRTWRIEADLWPATDSSVRVRWQIPDYRLAIYPPRGRPVRFAVNVKQSLTPKTAYETASSLRMQLRSWEETAGVSEQVDDVLLSTTFLSPRARELLIETGISYADSTGNIRIAVDDPPLFIETSGLDKPGAQGNFFTPRALGEAFPGARRAPSDRFFNVSEIRRPLRSFKGPGAALGVRALVDYRPPYGLRELADQAGVSLGTLSRVLEVAEGEMLVEREPRGPIRKADWERLLRRWAKDYSLRESNQMRLFLEPRGVSAVVAKLRAYGGRYAVSGSLAAHTVAPEAPAALAVIYIDAFEVADELNLRPVDTGGNVMLVRPFPSARGTQSLAPFLRTRSIEGLEYAALSQTVVDLLTSPGRGPAEAEALIEWMKENEDAWRLS